MSLSPTVPEALTASLTRHRVVPGKEAEVDEWMTMLNRRRDECLATLPGEQMAVEAVFRLRDETGDWLYWFELHGPGGGVMTGDHAIDRDHVAYASRCKVPGHDDAELMLLLMPDDVTDRLTNWVEAQRTN